VPSVGTKKAARFPIYLSLMPKKARASWSDTPLIWWNQEPRVLDHALLVGCAAQLQSTRSRVVKYSSKAASLLCAHGCYALCGSRVTGANRVGPRVQITEDTIQYRTRTRRRIRIYSENTTQGRRELACHQRRRRR
jgi:hypothetical protein